MAKDGLHALKFKELGQFDLLAQAGGHVAGPWVHFCKKARFEELVALGGLSTKLDFIHKISFFAYFRSVYILLVLSFYESLEPLCFCNSPTAWSMEVKKPELRWP